MELNIQDPAHHDVLAVNGVASVGGTLNVTLAHGAAPLQDGDTFDIFDFATTVGTFSTLNLPALSAGLGWHANDLYAAGELKVVSMQADYNQDDVIDGLDFLTWQRGESPDPHSAADLAAWRETFGAFVPQPSVAAAVPEPHSILIAALAAAAMAQSRRRITG